MHEGIRPEMFDVQERRLVLALEAAHNLNLMMDGTPYSYSDFQRFKEQGILAPDIAEFMADCEDTVERFIGRSATNDTLYNDGSRSTLTTLEPWTTAGEAALKADAQLETEQANTASLQERFHAITEPVATGFGDKLPETRQKKWGRSKKSGTSSWQATNEYRNLTHNYALDYTYGADDTPRPIEIRCKTEQAPGYPVDAHASLGPDGRVNDVSVSWAPRSPGTEEKMVMAAMDSNLAERVSSFDRLVSVSMGSQEIPPQVYIGRLMSNYEGRTFVFDPSQNMYVDEIGRQKYTPEDAINLLQELLKFLPTVKQPSQDVASQLKIK